MHPYLNQEPRQKWRNFSFRNDLLTIFESLPSPRIINSETKVISLGSCFAQHVSRHLRSWGVPYLQEISKNSVSTDFSAEWGNIYTIPQASQLVRHAVKDQIPNFKLYSDWTLENGTYVDPTRPLALKVGFNSIELMEQAYRQLNATVRRLIKSTDILVFTLGLTEAWYDKEAGLYLGAAPGVVAGQYVDERHVYENLTVSKNIAAYREFQDLVCGLNPNIKIILTVSPVPLIATYENRSSLEANSYSKAVLRVVADEIKLSYDNTFYFPSYEIAKDLLDRSIVFDSDGRTVTDYAVDLIMLAFKKGFYRDALKLKFLEPNGQLDTEVFCDDDIIEELILKKLPRE